MRIVSATWGVGSMIPSAGCAVDRGCSCTKVTEALTRGLWWNGFCSAATEGKRLAEQLVASFAASTDPVGDAGECLASAALWLQTMKSRMQTGDSGGGLVSSPMSCLGSSGGSLGLNASMNGVNMLSPSHSGGNSGPGGLGNLAINSGPGLAHGNSLGNYLARGSLAGAVGSPSGVRGIMGRPGLRFEDYKDRPSDFLRVGSGLREIGCGCGGGAWNCAVSSMCRIRDVDCVVECDGVG